MPGARSLLEGPRALSFPEPARYTRAQPRTRGDTVHRSSIRTIVALGLASFLSGVRPPAVSAQCTYNSLVSGTPVTSATATTLYSFGGASGF